MLFLEGEPDLATRHEMTTGSNVEEMLKNDLAIEYKVVGDLKAAVVTCEKNHDFVTRDMLVKQIEDTEMDHADPTYRNSKLHSKSDERNRGRCGVKGSNKIVKHLNEVLKSELTAINQYFLHARMFKNWGLERLNEKEFKNSIRVMKEADKLIERILFLEGLPNLQSLGALSIGENVEECLKSDLQFEITSQRASLVAGINEAEVEQDFVTRDLLESLLKCSETSIDDYETQLSLINDLGIQNYIQAQMEED
jgi:bacterioferritin